MFLSERVVTMKLFVLIARDHDDSSVFAAFDSREAAEAHAVCIENAVVHFSPDLPCLAEGRSCISCEGREDCIEFEHKWGCTVHIKEIELNAPNDPIGFHNCIG